MVDVGPQTYSEITTVILVIVLSAFANALLYGTFFSLRRAQNATSIDLSDEINVCISINKELRLKNTLSEAIVANVRATFIPKVQ